MPHFPPGAELKLRRMIVRGSRPAALQVGQATAIPQKRRRQKKVEQAKLASVSRSGPLGAGGHFLQRQYHGKRQHKVHLSNRHRTRPAILLLHLKWH